MLSDVLSNAVDDIEECQKNSPIDYSDMADQINLLKVQMLLILLHLDLSSDVCELYTATDFMWLRTESLKRAETRAPHGFSEVFYECVAELRVQKFGK